ncbi:MAG: hypothetical protein K8R88_00780 [Armatimonadetes bacterium]|nr:hypothetical protein [Armatimonadota bacterium]
MTILINLFLGHAISTSVHALQAASDEAFFKTQLDMSAPSGPAFTVLGMDASKATTPANLQELSLTLANSFDESGQLKQGFQVSATLAKLGIGPRYSTGGSKFFAKPENRLKWASNLSLAAIKGASDSDKSARAAIGLALPIFDDTDWRGQEESLKQYRLVLAETIDKEDPLDPPAEGAKDEWKALGERVKLLVALAKTPEDAKALNAVLAAITNFVSDASSENYKLAKEATEKIGDEESKPNFDGIVSRIYAESYAKKFAAFVKEQNDSHWNRKKLTLSFAHSLFAADAAKDTLKADGSFAWIAYSDSLGKNSQITIFGRYGSKDRSFDADTKAWIVGNSKQFGARVKSGSSKSGFFLEYLSKELDKGAGGKNKQVIWQGGYEVSVAGGQWLQIALGKGSGKGVSKNILGINFSFNLGSSQEIKVKPSEQ